MKAKKLEICWINVDDVQPSLPQRYTVIDGRVMEPLLFRTARYADPNEAIAEGTRQIEAWLLDLRIAHIDDHITVYVRQFPTLEGNKEQTRFHVRARLGYLTNVQS